jgi:uncharacterized protein
MRRDGAVVVVGVVVLAISSAFADERAVVPWETLANVSVVRQKDRYVPEFSKQILALDKREVKLRGFMLPLEQGARHKHFLLSAQPPECAFCMPGTAEQFAEVLARTPVPYATGPVTVSGTFTLVRDDSGGLLYRLTGATVVEK